MVCIIRSKYINVSICAPSFPLSPKHLLNNRIIDALHSCELPPSQGRVKFLVRVSGRSALLKLSQLKCRRKSKCQPRGPQGSVSRVNSTKMGREREKGRKLREKVSFETNYLQVYN